MPDIRTDFYVGPEQVTVLGTEQHVGDTAPHFTAVTKDVAPFDSDELAGKVRVFIAVPSVDTSVCSCEITRFNEEISQIAGVSAYVVSCDLPFAQARYAQEHKIDSLGFISDHMACAFGTKYGCLIGKRRLLNRSVFVVGADDELLYVEYVHQNGDQPDYDAVLAAVREAVA